MNGMRSNTMSGRSNYDSSTLFACAALVFQFAHTASFVSRKLGVGVFLIKSDRAAGEGTSA